MSDTRPVATIEAAPRGRRLRRGPLTRSQILDSSLKLFSDKGFARTSVRDIAQAAGITDAAIYYHFDSKRDLFEALIDERGFTAALANLEGAVDRMQAEAEVPSPRVAITDIARGALELMYGNRDLMKVLMVEAMAEDAVAAEEYRILVERWERAEARILRYYAERGELRTEAPEELAAQLASTVIGIFADYLMRHGSSDAPEAPPPDLLRHVEVAMQHIVQGIT